MATTTRKDDPAKRRKKEANTRRPRGKSKRTPGRILIRNESIGNVNYCYRKLNQSSGPPRQWHVSVSTKSALWSYGGQLVDIEGQGNGGVLSSLDVFDYASGKWTAVGSGLPCRYQHSAVLHGEKMVVFGGSDEGGNVVGDMFSLTAEGTLESSGASGDAPGPRQGHQAGLITDKTTNNSKMFIFGGRGPNNTLLNDLYLFDFETNNWSKIDPKGDHPSPRVFSSACVANDKIFIYGGEDASGKPLSDFFHFNLSSGIWTEIPLKGKYIPPGKSGHSLIFLKREKDILLFGGDEKATAYEIYRYSLKDQSWSLVNYAGDSGVPRRFHSTGLDGSKLYLFGGRGETGQATLDVIEGLSDVVPTAPIIIESDDTQVKFLEWEARAMKQHPSILALHEQFRPFLSANSTENAFPVSYSMSPPVSRTEDPESLPPQTVVRLLVEFLRDFGLKETAAKLLKDTNIADVMLTEEGGLKKMLDFSTRILADTSVFSPEVTNFKWSWDLPVPSSGSPIDPEIKNLYHLPGFDSMKDSDDNIWEDDESTLSRNLGEIVAGNLNVLVSHLIHRAGKDFRLTFLWCYKNWTTSERVFNKLLELFNHPPEVSRSDTKRIRKSILIFLVSWLQECPLDFQEQSLANQLVSFLESTALHDTREPFIIKDLRTAHKKAMKFSNKKERCEFVCGIDNAPDPVVPKNIFSSDLKLEDVDAVEVARQMTLHVFHKFSTVPMAEFTMGKWETPDENAAYLNRAIVWFHRIRLWAEKEMEESDVKLKLKKFKHLHSICNILFELKNFDSLAAILLGLAAVEKPSQLKDNSWDDPSLSKAAQEISKIKNVWIPLLFDKAQTEYQTLLQNNKTSPLVPYLHSHLSGLSKIIQKETDFVTSTNSQEKTIVNFAKSTKLFKILVELREMQLQKYNLLPVIQIQLFFEQFPDFTIANLQKKRK